MVILLLLALAAPGLAALTYEVGPGRAYRAIGEVPWTTLAPGDTVLIYWREEPYREKWVICRQGAANAPITVRGVAGPGGRLPLISGDGAQTAEGLNYWNEARGVIKIGGANVPPDLMPRYITVENLEIASARPGYLFTGRAGAPQPYAENAAAIYVEKGEHLAVRNCILRDSGNGLFIGSSDTAPTLDVLVTGNWVYDNGNAGSIYEHNSYTEALGITFEYNHYGPLRAGAGGNNLKDRSAGLVVRYNWIEGGNRQLDLVDAGAKPILEAPQYRTAFVYGNILVEPAGAGNRQIVHYGGDSGSTGRYRKGTLYFYQNTVVSTRTDRTTLFRLSTAEEVGDARNNIFYASAGGDSVSLLDSSGVLSLSHNWLEPGWVASFGQFDGKVNDDGTAVRSEAPGFLSVADQDFRLSAASVCAGAGGPLAGAVLPDHEVTRQYVKHLGGADRRASGPRDIGAFSTAEPSARPTDRGSSPVRRPPRGAPRVSPGR